VKFEKKTVAIMVVAIIGFSLFVGLASAAVRVDPVSKILETLQGNTPKAIVFDKEIFLPSFYNSEEAVIELLPEADGKVYYGHITVSLKPKQGWESLGVFLTVTGFVGDRNITLDSTYGYEDELAVLNTDFTCERLVLLLSNEHPTPIPGIVWSVVEYTTCTDVSTLP
jgi:hypothetical protein